MTAMPGRAYSGELAPLTAKETEISAKLKHHVSELAGTIGERNVTAYPALERTAQYD